MDIIDPHLHLFNRTLGEYHWLNPQNAPFWPDKSRIDNDFSEGDLALNNGVNLAGFVHIEAGFDNRQPWRELDWLESHVSLPFKSIAYSAIDSPQFATNLAFLASRPSFIGIRDILGDNARAVLNKPICEQNLALLAARNAIFECQANLADSELVLRLCQLLKQIPALQLIINHCGMPEANAIAPPLADNLKQLAAFSRVSVKCSGFEMRDRQWQWPDVTAMLASLIDIFGSDRVMLASNFPLTLFTRSYQQLWHGYTALDIEPATLKKLCFANSKRLYRL